MSFRVPLTAVAAGVALSLAPLAPVAGQSAEDLRLALNTALAEHTYLAAAATGAALGGRTGEFKDAAAVLDANSVDLAKLIGAAYGAEAEATFLELWRRHIGFFVDYTTATARKHAAMQADAVNNLLGYAEDFAAFLSSANPNLPMDAVSGLVRTHVVGLRSVVDAQAAGNQREAYRKLRDAAAHMRMIADPLASAIAKQFPDKFAAR